MPLKRGMGFCLLRSETLKRRLDVFDAELRMQEVAACIHASAEAGALGGGGCAAFGIDLLRGNEGCAEGEAGQFQVLHGDLLQRADQRDGVQVVEVAEV